MTTGKKVLASMILLAGVFLLGYLPPRLQMRQLQQNLQTQSETIRSLQLSSQLRDLQGLAGLMLIEAMRQNFGLAAEHSTKYFAQLQSLIDEASNPDLKGALEKLAAERDSITAGLAQADPASTSKLQALFTQTNEVSRRTF
jgi:hypothetical protein